MCRSTRHVKKSHGLFAMQNNFLVRCHNPLARRSNVPVICVPRSPLITQRRTDALVVRSEQRTAKRRREYLGNFILSDRELVFVVDDDPAMLQGIRRVLKQHGYDTVVFASAEAFRRHEDYEKAICIVLDVNLNDGSGIELRRGLHAAGIGVPVIYMTANDTPAVREAALQSGCLAYLTKPFPAKSLIDPLKRASGFRPCANH